MMMFVLTPSLDSIEHKFNSKSIKFPKLHKVPTLEAININKPWSEWKERLRNFGVKPPKRRIELRWVTRRTRPKKPSSSRSFAREARGARGTRGTRGSGGSWGLKTKTEIFFPFFSSRQQQPKKIKINKFQFDRGRMGCPTGPDERLDRVPDGVLNRGQMGGPTGARWGARPGPDGGPDGCQTGCQTGARWGASWGARQGQTECPTGPDGRLDGVPNGVLNRG
jgi:hypothetical protein